MDRSDKNIGYGNPPKATRFVKGQSGNPKGRPKGSKNTLKLIEEILEQKISITQNGKSLKISKRIAMLTQFINSGVTGNLKSISAIIPYMLQIDTKNEENQKTETLSVDDETFITNFINNYLKGKNNE